MNDQISNSEKRRGAKRRRARAGAGRRLPEPVERFWFELQERLIWPLQDRFTHLGPGHNRTLFAGGAAVLAVGVAIAIALSTGGGSATQSTTPVATASPSEPLASTATDAAAEPEPEPKQEPSRETLHGAAPVFSPPSPASKGGEKTGKPNAAAAGATAGDASSSGGSGSPGSSASSASGGPASSDATDSTSPDVTTTPSPDSATISSDPASSAKGNGGEATSSSARASVPDGPPAGPAALKVAREFAQGFVVYETGGEAADFRAAFAASATPELTKALLQRPPKQPAGVKVPRAKVLNVVAGPSQGRVYKVSVSLLRVGVTSELRLDMEKVETAGDHGKRVEWRVTNVLG